jgi:hypothetical protein
MAGHMVLQKKERGKIRASKMINSPYESGKKT